LNQISNTILFCGLCVALLSTIGCQEDEVASHWSDREITIDGEQTEWHGRLWVSEPENIAIGIMNDESNLYLTLSTSDRNNIMQIMRLGLTVWFDPKGGTKEVFGIKYPFGIRGMGTRSTGRSERPRDYMPDMEEQVRSLQKSQLWIEVLGPGKDDVAWLSVMDTTGIRVKTGLSTDGRFVYELKIPLGPSLDNPYAVNTSPGKTVGIGFETGEIDLAAMRSQRAGSGMRGGGMRGGRRPGGMPGVGQGRQMPEPFRYWIRVTLDSG